MGLLLENLMSVILWKINNTSLQRNFITDRYFAASMRCRPCCLRDAGRRNISFGYAVKRQNVKFLRENISIFRCVNVITHRESFRYPTFVAKWCTILLSANDCLVAALAAECTANKVMPLCNIGRKRAQGFFYRCLLFLTLCVNN